MLRVLRAGGWLLLGLAGLAAITAMFARILDGPIGPFPGGPLITGELVSGPDPDWSFAAKFSTIEAAIEAGGCDLTGILHDISICAKAETHRGGRQNVIFFKVWISKKLHELKIHIGPGDTAAPVLTLMLPHED